MIRLGFTRRKLSILAYERDNYLRADFTRLISQFRSEQFIFIDESSKDNRNANRYYGYLPKGTRHYSSLGHFVRKHRVSLLAAIDISSIQGAFVVEGAFNAELFNFGVQYFILDKIGSFAAGDDRFVVVLDNARIHDSDEFIEMIRSKGGIVIFLPPYSTQFKDLSMS